MTTRLPATTLAADALLLAFVLQPWRIPTRRSASGIPGDAPHRARAYEAAVPQTAFLLRSRVVPHRGT